MRPETAAAWGGQILVREHRQGVSSAHRLGFGTPDPVRIVVDRLAGAADPAAAARLLGEREAWSALLVRSWDDDAAALATVIGAVRAEPGPAGDTAVRSGLAALGTGLSPEAPGVWAVDRDTAASIAPALGSAVTAHVSVVAGLLGAAGAGEPLALPDDETLRGLGYLTQDARAAAEVQRAVDAWTVAAPLDPAGTSPTAPLEAVAVRSALVAAREYGQRLDHAMDAFLVMEGAVDRKFTYDVTIRLTFWLAGQAAERHPVTRPLGEVIGEVVDLGARLANADGSWEIPPDEGLLFDREDAADAAAALVPAGDPVLADAVARQARASFDRATQVLGVPRPPAAVGMLLDPALVDDQADLRQRHAEEVASRGRR